MKASSNIPLLFDKHFYAKGREGFAQVHRLECLEVLDNLGYVTAIPSEYKRQLRKQRN